MITIMLCVVVSCQDRCEARTRRSTYETDPSLDPRGCIRGLGTPPGAAQDGNPNNLHNHVHVTPTPTASPYAGMERRKLKALSEQQIDDLRGGRGMGPSLAAELNGYAGPVHILELADPLRLSDDQRAKAKELFQAMKAETVPIGERILAEETALDLLFSQRRATRAELDALVSRIASAQGDLRAAHLRYHLAMTGLLSPEQLRRYVPYCGGRD